MYLARFSYDVAPANRQRALDSIHQELETAVWHEVCFRDQEIGAFAHENLVRVIGLRGRDDTRRGRLQLMLGPFQKIRLRIH